MVAKFIALYKKPQDLKAFEDRYFNEHLGLAKQIPGLEKMEISCINGSPMGDSNYCLMAELYFASEESLKAGLSSPEGKAAGKNIMSFAGDIVTMMFAEVKNHKE